MTTRSPPHPTPCDGLQPPRWAPTLPSTPGRPADRWTPTWGGGTGEEKDRSCPGGWRWRMGGAGLGDTPLPPRVWALPRPLLQPLAATRGHQAHCLLSHPAGAWGLRALPARAVPLWWALQVRTGPPAPRHPAARHPSSRSCRRVEKPERVLTQNGSQAGRATPLTAARSGQEGQAGHFRSPGLGVGADTMEGKLPGHSQLFLSSGLGRRSWGEV